MKAKLTAEELSHLETLTTLLKYAGNESKEVYELLNVVNSLVMAIDYKNNKTKTEIDFIGTPEFHNQCYLIDSLKVQTIKAITELI